MDTTKLEGLIQAIEAEAHAPAPSHANLARLTAMALRDIAPYVGVPPAKDLVLTDQGNGGSGEIAFQSETYTGGHAMPITNLPPVLPELKPIKEHPSKKKEHVSLKARSK